MTETPFEIFTAPGYEAVADVFRAHFDTDADGFAQDVGAQFCIYQGENCLVDAKGGWMDRAKTQAVTDTTLFSVYSSGKTAAALVIAHLVENDLLGYNQPVVSIWPEFGAHGKDSMSVAQVLSHQAGLSGITDPNWKSDDWYDWDKTCATLAAQEPIFPPGSDSGYHPITYGFLAGEIARRADTGGRTLGQILRQDICAPHDLDVWIGLPESEHNRCVDMIRPKAMADLGELNPATRAAFLNREGSPNPRDPAKWRSAEFAGSNCQASAKGLAKMMQMYVNGTVCGEKFLSEDTLNAARQSRIKGDNLVLPFYLDFAAGIMRNPPNYFYGPGDMTLGHNGWGGSCVFADPETGLSGAYAMSRQDNTLLGDARPRRLIDAIYAALD